MTNSFNFRVSTEISACLKQHDERMRLVCQTQTMFRLALFDALERGSLEDARAIQAVWQNRLDGGSLLAENQTVAEHTESFRPKAEAYLEHTLERYGRLG